jgi:hypothetical protein
MAFGQVDFQPSTANAFLMDMNLYTGEILSQACSSTTRCWGATQIFIFYTTLAQLGLILDTVPSGFQYQFSATLVRPSNPSFKNLR